jgi:hypothetical protein
MELISIAQSRSLPAGYVMRAKLILLLAEGATFAAIRELRRREQQRPSTISPEQLKALERLVIGVTNDNDFALRPPFPPRRYSSSLERENHH